MVMLFIGFVTWGSNVANADTATRSSEEIEQIADKYVKYSEVEKKFYVAPEINNELNSQEVNSKVDLANQQLNKSLNQNDKMDTVLIVENNGEFYNLNQFYFRKAGITTVVFKWNYARVFISKQDLKTMGIWIPHKIAAGVMATLGVAMQNSPPGI